MLRRITSLRAVAGALATTVMWATSTLAGEPPVGTLTLPKPIDRRSPDYPVVASMSWQEGWVLMSYCVDETGGVHTPVIERSSGVPAFERAALRTIPSWKYEPARRDGRAVEVCQVRVRLSFSMHGMPRGARVSFAKRWKKASRLIDEAKLAEAKQILDELSAENNYESARLSLARARIAANTGDRKQELGALRMALLQPQAIEPDLRKNVKRKVFALEVSQRDWASAHETYADLAEEVDSLSDSERRAGAQLAALVAGDQPLATDAELECRCDKSNGEPLWSARLLRREFGFSDATGKIDRFELRCTGTRFSAKFDTESAWTVPTSWGNCTLFVFGEEGAKFRLVELAPQVAASAASASPAP